MYGVRKCRPVAVKRNLKIKANVVVSERTVCYRVVTFEFYMIMFYMLFLGVLTPKIPC